MSIYIGVCVCEIQAHLVKVNKIMILLHRQPHASMENECWMMMVV